MSVPPAVSIVMPIYNTRPFLTEAVESVLEQDYDDWELLLVDDGRLFRREGPRLAR